MAFVREKSTIPAIEAAMLEAFQEVGLGARLFTPSISNLGASLTTV
jgi:hypothetical protein